MSSDLTKDAIEAKLAQNPGGASNLAMLEAFVAVQVASAAANDGSLSSTYSLTANRTLLKLYQFQPAQSDPCKAATLLALSLVASYSTGGTDVMALVYLLPERILRAEPCATALKCYHLLDSCQFTEFWKVWATLPGDIAVGDPTLLSKVVNGAQSQLRRAILQVWAVTYKSAPLGKVLEALNLKTVDELQALQEPCVEAVNGDTIVFVATSNNTKRERVFQEGLGYAAIAEMMAKVVATE